VVAEGIEEQLDVEFLTRLGCDMGQGWLLGRPLPAQQLAPLLPSPSESMQQRQDAA
jgi:EAL domain-containing protein (putative c-di-GMP-specific phosphodiesterase class I)